MTYIELLNKTMELYLQEKYFEAYTFITANSGKIDKGTALPGNTIMALPQSSQTAFSDAYVWHNLEKGCRELKAHVKGLLKTHDGHFSKMIAGGFSAGARVIVHSVCKCLKDVQGIILLGPWLPDIDKWTFSLENLRKTKNCIICGDKDEDCLKYADKFAERLDKENIPYRYTIIPGLKHDYPYARQSLLHEAFEYIKGEKST